MSRHDKRYRSEAMSPIVGNPEQVHISLLDNIKSFRQEDHSVNAGLHLDGTHLGTERHKK